MCKQKSLKKVRIFAASPSDLIKERTRLKTIVEELKSLAGYIGVTLDLVDWREVIPDLGNPEHVILDQLNPDTWDVFIGILWHRFGTPTQNVNPQTGKKYLSGTEEEFHLAYNLWLKHQSDKNSANEVPLQEALGKQALLIKGDPGAGKTTFLRMIAFTLCQKWLGEEDASQEGRDCFGLIRLLCPSLSMWGGWSNTSTGAWEELHI